jgi:glutathione S-transferase
MLKVYGRANSINVRKVLWIADEIGIPYEREDWGRGYRPTSEAEFQKVSRFSVVPVIDDDGFILRESNTIVRYLAAKHGRADLYPTEAKARAAVEMWMDYAITDLYSGMRPVFMGLANNMVPWNDPAMIRNGIEDWNRQFKRLDDHLAAGGPYVAGDHFTVADIPVGLMTNRWSTLSFDKPDLPHVRAYYDRLGERPPFRTHGRNGTP